VFFREIITVYGGNYMTHRIVLHFITVLQQLVHIITIMLALVDNDDGGGGGGDDDFDDKYKALEEKTRLTEFNYLNVTERESILEKKPFFIKRT
jgi:hypothetical protein